MKTQLIKQFKAELWANELTIKAIKEAKEPEERAFKLMGHIVASHHSWLNKLLSKSSTVGSWDLVSLDEIEKYAKGNYSAWEHYLSISTEEDFNRQLEFKFLGSDVQISIADLIIHLLQHSAYHRGQIIASLKGKIDVLPLTTYIAFAKRDKK